MSLSIGVLPYSKYRLEELNKQYYADADKSDEIMEQITRLTSGVARGDLRLLRCSPSGEEIFAYHRHAASRGRGVYLQLARGGAG